MTEQAKKSLELAVRNAEARLYLSAPLGASYGQPERAALESELRIYRNGLESLR